MRSYNFPREAARGGSEHNGLGGTVTVISHSSLHALCDEETARVFRQAWEIAEGAQRNVTQVGLCECVLMGQLVGHQPVVGEFVKEGF